jgi:Ca2+-binding EF-hand superfamily protein
MDEKNFVNFYELIDNYKLTEYEEAFNLYIEELWKDLSAESIDVKKGVSREIFLYYYDIPRLINQHIFTIFDKDRDNFLNFEEFKNTLTSIFYSNDYYTLSKFIFDLYDCDRDGYITDEDCRLMLSYIPITGKLIYKEKRNDIDSITFDDRKFSQQEIFRILKKSFQNNIKIKYPKFCEIIENYSSDILIQILIYLLEKRPFNENILKHYVPKKIINEYEEEEEKEKEEIIIKTKNIIEPSLNQEIHSPIVHRNKKVNFTEFLNINLEETKEDTKQNELKFFLKRKTYKLQTESKSNSKKVQNIIDFEKISSSHSGYVFKITNNDKLKVYFLELEMQDIFYYKNRTDNYHIGMHHLTYKTYLRKNKIKTLKDVRFYNFSLIEPKNTHNFYFSDEEQYNQWYIHFQKCLNFKELEENYEIEEVISKGRFGIVEKGRDKLTGRTVCIHIIDKKKLTSGDKFLLSNQISIQKYIQHPNISKLITYSHEEKNTYIVTEFINGSTLLNYLQNKNFIFEEKKACELIQEILFAIYYLHSYGIIHRDIKPENIMTIDNSEDTHIKLIDFTVSKIISKNELMKEPYGTLSYIAPEILEEKPYNEKVDEWSIGILTYLLLSETVPFDDDHSEREIARQTMYEPVKFDSPIWKNRSNESKDFILKLLEKKPEKRMGVKDALVHKWIQLFFPDKVSQRIRLKEEKNFEFDCYSSLNSDSFRIRKRK